MNLNQEYINDKLISNSGSLLKKEYKTKWSKSNPTLGYCYIVSEALYHYGNYNNNYKSHCINFEGDIGTHWYLSNGLDIIDFTADQFNFKINYSLGIGKQFLKGSIKTNKGYISKRGYEMAKILKLIGGV